MKYDDIINIWLQAHDVGQQYGTNVKADSNYPVYNLNADDGLKLLGAMGLFDGGSRSDAYSLYAGKADPRARQMEYPTSALNFDAFTAFIQQASKDPMNPLYTMAKNAAVNYPEIPQVEKRLVPQAVYEHEIAHRNTEPVNFVKYSSAVDREDASMLAEDKFWDQQSQQYKKTGIKNRKTVPYWRGEDLPAEAKKRLRD